MKQYIFLFAILLYYGPLRAQLPVYYVRFYTGSATVSHAGKKATAVFQKQFIYKDDIIVLKKGAKLTLSDDNANFLTLNKAGTYTVGDVSTNATIKKDEGATAQFVKLVFHEFLDPDEDFEKFKKRNITSARGGGSRGDDECNNVVFPVKNLKTSADTLVFRWYQTDPSSKYSFFIYDDRGKELFKKMPEDTLLVVNLKETLHEPGKYLWRAIGENENCEGFVPVAFEILTTERESKMAEELLKDMPGKSIEEKLSQVDRLVKNGFIDVASSRYASLIKEYPEDKALMKSYVLFLFQFGFDDEAKAAWR